MNAIIGAPGIGEIYGAARFVSGVAALVKGRGISLAVGDDFDDYAAIVARQRPEQPLGLPFQSERHYLTSGNAFWILGRDSTGTVVHTQAVRKLDLAGNSLAQFMSARFRDFPPMTPGLDLQASRYRPGPAARSMGGTVCYHGDVWLRGGSDGHRGTGVSSLLARYALALAFLRFRPDFMMAFMPSSIAFKGLTEREGYMHAEPGTLRWNFADSEEVIEGFMVWNSGTDIAHLINQPVKHLLV